MISGARLAAILLQTGRASECHRRLSAESVVWLVIAMTLFVADSIPKVGRRLHPGHDQPEPNDSAFTQARKRLGVAPLRHLFLQVAHPMATHQTKGAFYGGWRLMGIDGTTLDLPDTPANARTFGRPRDPRADAAFPQVRLLALCERRTDWATVGAPIGRHSAGLPSKAGEAVKACSPWFFLSRPPRTG